MKRILIAGASGLIGRQAAFELASVHDFEVHVILRRELDNAGHLIQHVADTGRWPPIISGIGADVAISCLGTTMQAAGSRLAFQAVDHELVIAFARAARDAGAKQFITVSSVGASPKSGNFYLRTKGTVEAELAALNFERLDIMRPGLLTGGRRADSRAAESVAIALAPFTDLLMRGRLSRYRSTPSAKVARAIAGLIGIKGNGHFIHENNSIGKLAG